MSKNLSLLNGGSGKIGEIVLQRHHVQRVRKREIKNPRTFGQIAARVVTATMTGMLVGLKGVVDHSFENVPYGAKSLAHFRKLNAKNLMALAKEDLEKQVYECEGAFLPKGFIGCLPNEVIVSQGSLPYDHSYLPWFDPNEGNNGQLKMMSGVTSVDITGMTVAEWLWEFWGLRPGQQLTWIFIGSDSTGLVYTSPGYIDSDTSQLNRALHRPAVKIMRMVIKEEKDFTYKNIRTQPDINWFLGSELYGAIDWNKTDSRFADILLASGQYTWTPDDDQDPTQISMAMSYVQAVIVPREFREECYAAAGIVSEQEGGKWRRTTSKLIRTEAQRYFNNEGENLSPVQGLDISDAIDSWYTSSLAQSDRYLNEG